MALRYLARRRAELAKLTALLAASDFERIAILGHNMKGSGAAYGFTPITIIGAALERSARQRDTPALSILLTDLGDCLSNLGTQARW
jgi:HPt (histidine-containing phosphotransfer) domain-containing protein